MVRKTKLSAGLNTPHRFKKHHLHLPHKPNMITMKGPDKVIRKIHHKHAYVDLKYNRYIVQKFDSTNYTGAFAGDEKTYYIDIEPGEHYEIQDMMCRFQVQCTTGAVTHMDAFGLINKVTLTYKNVSTEVQVLWSEFLKWTLNLYEKSEEHDYVCKLAYVDPKTHRVNYADNLMAVNEYRYIYLPLNMLAICSGLDWEHIKDTLRVNIWTNPTGILTGTTGNLDLVDLEMCFSENVPSKTHHKISAKEHHMSPKVINFLSTIHLEDTLTLAAGTENKNLELEELKEHYVPYLIAQLRESTANTNRDNIATLGENGQINFVQAGNSNIITAGYIRTKDLKSYNIKSMPNYSPYDNTIVVPFNRDIQSATKGSIIAGCLNTNTDSHRLWIKPSGTAKVDPIFSITQTNAANKLKLFATVSAKNV